MRRCQRERGWEAWYLAVALHVLRHVRDTRGKHGDLHLRRPGIVLMQLVPGGSVGIESFLHTNASREGHEAMLWLRE